MVDCTTETAVEFHTVLFDANPLPTFVLDSESRIVEFNDAAADFLGTAPSEVFRHRSGDLFQCVNATESLDGCGSSAACRFCGIRRAIAAALTGDRVSRCFHSMDLIRNDQPVRVDFLITAAPVEDGETKLALLMLEDVTELMQLRRHQNPA